MKAKPFTGYHMAAILMAFFAVVIAVNLVMAKFAISSFGGTVVDNSYVASQNYNHWLDRAEAQKKLGWKVSAGLNSKRRIRMAVSDDAGAVPGLSAAATATHPLGAKAPLTIALNPAADGVFVSTAPLPAGRWILDISISRGDQNYKLREEIQ